MPKNDLKKIRIMRYIIRIFRRHIYKILNLNVKGHFIMNFHGKDIKIFAGSIQVNPVIVRNTPGLLSDAGLVEVKAGVGGAFLAKVAGEITLLDIFKAVAKEEALFHFHENPNPLCPVGRNIHSVMDKRLDDIQSAMERQMEETTLSRLVEETAERAQRG